MTRSDQPQAISNIIRPNLVSRHSERGLTQPNLPPGKILAHLSQKIIRFMSLFYIFNFSLDYTILYLHEGILF